MAVAALAGVGLAGVAMAATRKSAAGSVGGVTMLETTNGTVASGPLGTQAGELKGVPGFAAYDGLFRAQGAAYGVDPLALKAIALQESSLNPRAVNNATPGDPSYGLMQISCMPDGQGGCLANEFNLPDWPPSSAAALFDPGTSIHYAAEIMAANLGATGGNMAQAVAMYNSGSTVDPAYVAGVQHFYSLMGGGTL